jgi:hypothetical protein
VTKSRTIVNPAVFFASLNAPSRLRSSLMSRAGVGSHKHRTTKRRREEFATAVQDIQALNRLSHRNSSDRPVMRSQLQALNPTHRLCTPQDAVSNPPPWLYPSHAQSNDPQQGLGFPSLAPQAALSATGRNGPCVSCSPAQLHPSSSLLCRPLKEADSLLLLAQAEVIRKAACALLAQIMLEDERHSHRERGQSKC